MQKLLNFFVENVLIIAVFLTVILILLRRIFLANKQCEPKFFIVMPIIKICCKPVVLRVTYFIAAVYQKVPAILSSIIEAEAGDVVRL